MVKITKHFNQRFKQRLANTPKIQEYANNAYIFGVEVNDIKMKSYATSIEQKEEIYGTVAKIYKNFIYWFDGLTAITIYPIPQKMHGKI